MNCTCMIQIGENRTVETICQECAARYKAALEKISDTPTHDCNHHEIADKALGRE